MIKKLIGATVLGLMALGTSMTANAIAVTDVQDYSNNVAGEYFVDVDANKYNSPYYRWFNQDWGWTHNAIAGTFTSISLDISAFDVDWPSELDMISVWDGATWATLGDLSGGSDIWSFTSFDLSGFAWAEAQVNAGLQVRVDIDSGNTSGFNNWALTLAKATLSVDGGSQTCVPQPGVPCVSAAEPASLALIGLGLVGFGVARRRKA
ncbi:MAG: PEP-CTERM sorting domain-containing protein [Gammaproteobacteria bacterium]|nr:PEP-CTERM sorting domain-containing protein [Gammaproteobacteria bacterium]